MLATENGVAVRFGLMGRVYDARRRSDALFSVVRAGSLYERPIPERHRIIFYVGHLEAFDWNLLHENIFGLKSFHPEFDRLFAFGIDPVGGGLPLGCGARLRDQNLGRSGREVDRRSTRIRSDARRLFGGHFAQRSG